MENKNSSSRIRSGLVWLPKEEEKVSDILVSPWNACLKYMMTLTAIEQMLYVIQWGVEFIYIAPYTIVLSTTGKYCQKYTCYLGVWNEAGFGMGTIS